MIGTNTILNDRYRLVSVLATGGMGVIWRGWDKRSQSVVAVKVLKEDLVGQETFLARLRAEAQNAARLRHPNLAAVYDWGETEGQGWIVMELVEGRPLSDILAGGHRMDWEQLASILAQIAGGLQACHENNVIHRDVKPANILVSDKGVAKLTDFGISLAPRAEALTAAGMVMGTAQYLPPEQAMGEKATASGDIYALGVIAYEALAGRRPFTGATQVDIALSHVKDPVPPLPAEVPEGVAQLVYRMLEKDPRLRPASVAEVVTQIKGLWHGQVPLAFTPRMAFSRTPNPEPTQEMSALSSSRYAAAVSGSPVTPPSRSATQVSAQPYTRPPTQPSAQPPAQPPAQPSALPVTPPAFDPARRQAVMAKLQNPNLAGQRSNRNKIIASVIISVLVLIALIIGLVTTTQHSASPLSAPGETRVSAAAANQPRIPCTGDAPTQEEHLDGDE